jgi:hypothetical protein
MRGERSGGGGSGPAQRVFFLIFFKLNLVASFRQMENSFFVVFWGGFFSRKFWNVFFLALIT